MCSWVSPPSMWTVVTRTMLDPSPTFPSMRETQAHHPPVILGSCRSVLTGSWTGRKRRRDRGVPCRGGPRRAAVLLDGQRPRAGAAPRGNPARRWRFTALRTLRTKPCALHVPVREDQRQVVVGDAVEVERFDLGHHCFPVPEHVASIVTGGAPWRGVWPRM